MGETSTSKPVRLAAVGNLHCTKASVGQIAPWLARVNELADVLLLCGDLTDFGRPDEARVLARELGCVRIPMLGVLGNHDYESGREADVAQILGQGGLTLLSGDAVEVAGVGFTGIKGFGGGFGAHTLGHWGEPEQVESFVDHALDQAQRLESGLARLRTEQRVVLLHYSPVSGTIEGEPAEIFPFLGSSRLEEPLLRHPVSAVFHGHAHRGQLEARTSHGRPVYNVAMPLLQRRFPESCPFRVVELRSGKQVHAESAAVGLRAPQQQPKPRATP